MNSTILVTGAAGFVGSYVTQTLADAGYRVRAMVRRPEQAEALRRPNVTPCIADVRDAEALRQAVQGVNGICHIAALFRQADSPDSVYYDINANGVRNVFDAAIAAGVPRVIHCSTVGVLGHIEHPPANEDTPCNPGDVYQRSKFEGEKIALEYYRAGRVGGVVLRPAMIYGPGDRRTLKMFRMIARGCFFYVGRGANLVHFIDVRDLAEAFRRALERTDRNGDCFIIAGARAMPLRELAGHAARTLGVRAPRLCLPVRPMQWMGSACEALCVPLGIAPPIYRRRVDFYTKDRSFDTRRARERLDFAPRQTPEAEIHDILDDYQTRGWL